MAWEAWDFGTWVRRAAALVAPALAVFGLDAGLKISQYQKQYWQVEQGLPHSYVTAIAEGPEGYLLVGTDEGLARFDGLTFRPVAADASLRLSRRWVSALRTSRDGSVWAGTFDGQVVHLRTGRPARTFDLGGSVFALYEDSAGGVWASTRNGVFCTSAGQTDMTPVLDAPLETSWNVLTGDTQGTTWIVSAQGLSAHRNGKIMRRLANGGSHGEILSVTAGRGGRLWLGTSKGLYSIRGEETGGPARAAAVPGPVVALLEDHDGTVWAGTWGQGLYRVAGERVESWRSPDGLPNDFVRTLAEDSEGGLWIGMRSGLGRWSETQLVPMGPQEGLAGDYATTVAADPNGDLWLGTWRGGLYRLRNGVPESQPTPLPTLYFTVRALAFDRTGHPWVGNWEGVFQYDGTHYRRYGGEAGSPYQRVAALLFDRTGGLWVGTTNRGIFRFATGIPTDPAAQPLLGDQEITALYEDSTGKIWVGTSKGLGWFASAEGGEFHAMDTRGEDSIESITEDSRRRIWATTADGKMVAVADGKATVLEQRHGLPDHALYRLLEDGTGAFWISSPRGILRIERTQIEDLLAGKRETLEPVRYDQNEGMRTIECHGLSQPAGWKAKDGNLWFPTSRGFVQIRPAAERTLPAPKARVELVRTEAGAVAMGSPVELEAGARNVELVFTAIRLSSPRKVQFRYRIVGFDPDWVTARAQRAARYTQLPAGWHTFEVQARDAGGSWGETASVRVRQHPRFHQTWWFLGLLGVAAVTTAAAMYRWRLHTVSGRYKAVLEERNRIGREWHDTLVAGFSAISLQLEAAMSRVKEQPERASEILDVTRKMVHHYRAEARRVIWDLRDSRPEGETLTLALHNALRRVTENRGIDSGMTVSGVEPELPADLQHNVLRICQEAMSNAARHAGAARIEVAVEFGEAMLTASVADNGKGFDTAGTAADATGHFGLTVMQERARRFGGELRLESEPGKGTKVEATVPIPAKGAK